MNIATGICDLLLSHKITHIYAMSGANNEDLLNEVQKYDELRLTIVKNEANAVFMAMGSYLKSKQIAAVITTSGAAILNTIAPLTEAFTSRIPLLVIGGQIPQKFEGTGAFQDNSGCGSSVDILNFFTPTTIFQKRIESQHNALLNINDAIKATVEKKRPSIILIPKNLIQAKATNIPRVNLLKSVTKGDKYELNHDIDLVILGEELLHLKDLTKITSLVRSLNAKVALTPSTKGLYDNCSKEFIGIIGVMGSENISSELAKTKSILLLGTSWDVISRFEVENLLLDKLIFSIGNTEHYIFCKDYHHHQYDASDYVENNYVSVDLNIEERPKNKIQSKYNWQGILESIDNSLSIDADLFIDAGNTGAHCVRNLNPRGNAQFFLSLGQGGMGNSFGAAIGCSTVTKKRSYIFSGDGSFLINGLELHTAIQNNLPLCVFIFNNNSHGMCKIREDIFLDTKTSINNFKPSHYAKGLKAMFEDIESFEVNSIEDLRVGLTIMNSDGYESKFFVFNININETEIPPFKTFIKEAETQDVTKQN